MEIPGRSIFEEELHIPLIIYLPEAAGRGFATRRLPAPVDLTDLAPTLLDAVGLPPLRPMHGESLLPHALDGKPLRTPEAFAETRLPYAKLQALRVGADKIVVDHLSGHTSRVDLSRDPGERAVVDGGEAARAVIDAFIDLHLARVPRRAFLLQKLQSGRPPQSLFEAPLSQSCRP